MFSRLAKRHRFVRAGAAAPLAFALTLALGMLAPGAMAAPAQKADPSNVSLDIIQPAPNNGVAEGPVGANIAVSGTVGSGDNVQIGVAAQSDGCTNTGFQPLNGITATAGSDGSFTATFAWPQIANNVGGRYFVCAQDTTAGNALGASQSLYQVDSSDAPTISVTEVNDPNAPTPGPSTPTAGQPNPPDGTYYSGGFIEVKGQNFTPGGIQIQLLVTLQQLTPATAASPSLTIVKGVAQTRRDGQFDVIAQLPSGTAGQYYLSATSSDGTTTVLPTLVGSQAITLALAPTPTPQPTATSTPKATATSGSSTTDNTGGGGGIGKGRIAGAIALGLFSAIFFIIGVALLISATGMGAGGAASDRPQLR